MKKLCWFIMLLAAVLFCGCEKEEPFAADEDIPYVRYDYYRSAEDVIFPFRTITETGRELYSGGKALLTYRGGGLSEAEDSVWPYAYDSFGAVILHSPEELEAVLRRPDEDREAAIQKLLGKGYSNEQAIRRIRETPLITEKERTRELTFDETFFEANSLLAVDLCSSGALYYKARPEKLLIRDGDVYVQVRYAYTEADTAGNGGTLLLIPVPKECRHVDAEYEFVESWKEKIIAYKP